MKKNIGLLAAALVFAFCMAQAASAVTIEYELNNIGGERWQYDFTIYNDTVYDFAAFDIGFGLDVANLKLLNTGYGWGRYSLVTEPTDYYNGVLMAGADDSASWILPGASLGVFSVALDWLGNQGPDLSFFAYDFDFGWERLQNVDYVFFEAGGPVVPDPIPEPGTLALLGTGLAGLAAYYRSRKAVKR